MRRCKRCRPHLQQTNGDAATQQLICGLAASQSCANNCDLGYPPAFVCQRYSALPFSVLFICSGFCFSGRRFFPRCAGSLACAPPFARFFAAVSVFFFVAPPLLPAVVLLLRDVLAASVFAVPAAVAAGLRFPVALRPFLSWPRLGHSWLGQIFILPPPRTWRSASCVPQTGHRSSIGGSQEIYLQSG